MCLGTGSVGSCGVWLDHGWMEFITKGSYKGKLYGLISWGWSKQWEILLACGGLNDAEEVKTEQISYWRLGSCVFWTFFRELQPSIIFTYPHPHSKNYLRKYTSFHSLFLSNSQELLWSSWHHSTKVKEDNYTHHFLKTLHITAYSL